MIMMREFQVRFCQRHSQKSTQSTLLKKSFLFLFLSFISLRVDASCPPTTPWSTPVNISNSGNVANHVFSAATSAGFMAVWPDSSNNANYSFSPDGLSWQTGLVGPAAADVASGSDVFVAGNSTGFMVAWMDSSNNAWSSFSTNNGNTWSAAIAINPNTLALDGNTDVYVSGGSGGFVAAMIGADENAYLSFSTGTAAWSTPTQVTTDGSVDNKNGVSPYTRGFVSVVVVDNSCMVTWILNTYGTASAYFDSINPFSSVTVYPLASIGFFESVPIVAQLNGYFMTATRANEGPSGITIFTAATTPANWAIFSLFATTPNNPDAGPWIAANHAGFMSTWVVGSYAAYPGTPMWTFSSNNGFNWTPVCSILATPSTTIGGPVGMSGNDLGFVATWLDGSDSNAYASFYPTPLPNPEASNNIFVVSLEQKYGRLL